MQDVLNVFLPLDAKGNSDTQIKGMLENATRKKISDGFNWTVSYVTQRNEKGKRGLMFQGAILIKSGDPQKN